MSSLGTENVRQSNCATFGARAGTIVMIIGLLSICSPSFSKNRIDASFDSYTGALHAICPEKNLAVC